jgi:acyl-CoA thioesterase-1
MLTRRLFLLAATQIPEAFRGDPAFDEVKDDPALPRVLLIGDSISIGYTAPVRKLLAGKANVHRIPANGGPTTNGLERLTEWLGSSRWDVIHFNWGLHDLKIMEDGKHQVPLDAYEKNLDELVARLKATKAQLIWCTTTPVPSGKLNPVRRTEDVAALQRSRRARHEGPRHRRRRSVRLRSAAPGRDPAPENVHFTPTGSARLAETVAAAILKALPR